MKLRVLFFAAVALAGLAPAAVRSDPAAVLPDRTYRYDIARGGKTIGSSTIVVQRSKGALIIREGGSEAGTTVVTSRTLDAASFVTSSYSVETNGTTATMTIAGNDATLATGSGAAKITKSDDSMFVVNDNFIAGYAQLPATLRSGKKITMACVCGGFLALPLTVAAGEAANGVRNGDLAVEATVAGVTVRIWYAPQSFVLDRFEVPAQDLVVSLTSRTASAAALPKRGVYR